MAAQVVDGWAMLQQQTKRFTRTVKNRGAVDDGLIAWAYTEGQQALFDLVLESDVEWALKNVTVDDSASSFGTEVEFKQHRYFIETDLGITDLVRVRRVWRVDPNNEAQSQPMIHMDRVMDVQRVKDLGSTLSLMGNEGWSLDGDLEPVSGNHELALMIFNKGTSMAGGHIKLNYWFQPENVLETDFYQVDANGDLTKRPALPRNTWPAIMNYAHLVILETIEDQYKNHSLWRRMNGVDGVLARARSSLARFQTGEPVYGQDTFGDEGT